MARSTPRVEGAALLGVEGDPRSIVVGSPAWYAWLEEASAFAFTSDQGSFTARKEQHGRNGWYWKAYRRQGGTLYRAYLGKSADLTLDRLTAIAAELAERGAEAAQTESRGVAAPVQVTAASDAAHTGSSYSSADALPLLATKLYMPAPRQHVVARPRLLARLAAGLANSLTLLAAPAGFGKTTLLAQGLGDGSLRVERGNPNSQPSSPSPRSVAWLSLDAADNDPKRFWSYVIAAIETARPGVGESARVALAAPQPPPIDSILTALINDLAGQGMGNRGWGSVNAEAPASNPQPPSPIPHILVLDDYHVITTPAIHDALIFLVDRLPPDVRLVLISRVDPPMPLSRWRARGQLAEIRAADLRFTPDEAAAFLADVMRLPLSPAEIAGLEARTEGWIAGLHLAALAMRDRGDLAGFVAAFTGSNHYVVDYLAQEVYAQQPAHIQQFLLQTSILEQMCGPLCDAVLGLTNQGDYESTFAVGRSALVDSYSQLILHELERLNLFVEPLDDRREWYRYHRLFADVMQARLQGGSSPAEVARIHRRASRWYERHGSLDASMRHALAAQDVDRAVELVERYFTALLMRGDVQLLGAWLRQLPPRAIEERPLLALAHAWVAALTGQPVEAERRLREAAALGDSSSLAADARAILALLRSNIALSGHDPSLTEACAREALEQLPVEHAYYAAWRAVAVRNIGIAALQRMDMATADQALDEAARLGLASRNLYLALAALGVLGRLQLQSGQLGAALRTGERTLALGAEHQIVPLAAAIACIGLGEVYCERDELELAIRHLTRGVDLLTQQSVEFFTLARGYAALARAQYGQGQSDLALSTLQRGLDWFAQVALSSPRAAALLSACRARLQLWRGERSAVVGWAAGRRLSNSWTPVIDPAIDECLTLVRVTIADGDPGRVEDALRVIDQLEQAAEPAALRGTLIELGILRALALDALGDEAAALRAFEPALTQAAAQGFVRVFVDEGAPMARLLRQSLDRRGQNDPIKPYVERLLAAFSGRDKETRRQGDLETRSSASLIEPLTERELEILRLIAGGLSNQAIADQLVVAVSTVKKHVNNLYGKLDVQSRTQALARARELGLL